jgi:outer membrane receptor for ferrienterochelin and colicin
MRIGIHSTIYLLCFMKLLTNWGVRTFLLFLIAAFGFQNDAVSQEDTLGVKLFDHRDLDGGDYKKDAQVSSNRLAENPDDLAQEIIIVSGDDIRKFGYSTLVDVLKSIPGFRTSQPGNAIEGETFLMRGLNGNDQTKILINGIPIKPEAAKGMPIAAQLPIRHAERIEIVLGPSSSTYGTGAMAGVINIVLPEIDRPVFAWADVNLLTPKSTEFNLTLGGKVGKGDEILNYEIFASSQQADDVNLLIPPDSIGLFFNPNDSSSQYYNALAFRDQDDPSEPEIRELKRESRLVGAYLKYRWFELAVMNMYRIEHSGFGTNPLNASYHNPGNTFGENINSFSLKFNGNSSKRFISNAALSVLTYRTLENSSYYGVTNFLSNGTNYMYARSVDFRADYQGTFKLNSTMKMAVGATSTYTISHPFTSFLARPFRSKDESTFNLDAFDSELLTGGYQSEAVYQVSRIDTTQTIERFTTFNIAPFAQFLYKSKSGKLNLELGSRVDINGEGDLVFTPKAGFVYRPVKNFRIRAYYGKGHRAPRSYYLFNNYTESAGAYNPQSGPGQPLAERLKRKKGDLKAEELHGAEFRASWDINENWNVTGRYFFHYMENRIMRQIFTPDSTIQDSSQQIGVGFFNGESYSFLNAGMITLNYNKEFKNKVELNVMLSYELSSGWEFVEANDSVTTASEKESDYRFVPQHSMKANFEVSLYDFTFSFRNNLFGNYVTEIFRQNNKIQFDRTDQFFYNLDILVHKRLFRQLSAFVGVYNVFETVQSGVPNVNISNSWTYNPQYGRTFKFGLNFQLN